MKIIDYLAHTTIATIVAANAIVTAIFGWWLKSRMDSSIKHEYDRLLESFKAEQKRSDVLHAERLTAFKVLSERLLALRRYCYANTAKSEFAPRPEDLAAGENISLLQHQQLISRALDERELFVSPNTRRCFQSLFSQMTIGCNMEFWIASGNMKQSESNSGQLYNLVVVRVNDVLGGLYGDLGFPEPQALQSSDLA